MRPRLQLNESGMSLVVTLVLLAVVGISAMVIMNMGSQKRKISQQMNLSVSANLVKQKLVAIVLSPQAWQITQAKNTQAFASFNPSHPPLLNLYTPESATPFYKVTSPRAGFDLKGIPCDTFSPQGNDDCPFRYEITLKNRVFQNGNWIDTIRFELSFKPTSSKLFLKTLDPQYNFDLVRNLNEQSVEYACVSVNGQYDANTNRCSTSLTKSNALCAGGTTYRGPASNGATGPAANCDAKTVPQTSCTGSNVIKGFSANGTPTCGPPL